MPPTASKPPVWTSRAVRLRVTRERNMSIAPEALADAQRRGDEFADRLVERARRIAASNVPQSSSLQGRHLYLAAADLIPAGSALHRRMAAALTAAVRDASLAELLATDAAADFAETDAPQRLLCSETVLARLLASPQRPLLFASHVERTANGGVNALFLADDEQP